MFELLLSPILAFLVVYALWIFYLAVMNLKRASDAGKLSKPARFLGTPVLVIGYVLDFASNLIFTIPFLDLPRETTVTFRLKRYAAGPDGWRKRATLWFADDLLDDFDPSNKHI